MWPEISEFERANSGGSIDAMRGVQLARTDKLTLLCVIDQLVIPNGFSVNRNSVIAKVSEEPNSSTLALALELKGFLPPAVPSLNLQSMRSCLQSLKRENIFVSVFFEFDKPNIAYLGDIVSMDKNEFQFRCVTPSAKRERKAKTFGIADCTRIDFFGEYETAIHLSSLFLASNG
jgi:hypothetical protein